MCNQTPMNLSLRGSMIGLAGIILCIGLSCKETKKENKPSAKVEIPGTPSGNKLVQWLTVFEKGNQDSMDKFIADNYAKALLDTTESYWRAERQARTYADTHGFSIDSIEKSSEEQTIVVAQGILTGLWFRIGLTVDSTPSHKILAYFSQRIPPPPGKFQKISERNLPGEIKKFLDGLNKEDAFSGGVLLVKDDKVILKEVYGLANKAYNVPMKEDTKLNIASVTKMFTAVAIFQLIEKGSISVTDTIGKFLPDYKNKQVSRKVTIHHLLCHSSGLGDYHGEKYICDKGILRQVNDWFPLFENDSLSFEPGSKWQYSNAGYIILGAIIEKVSGENYFDYISNHIFKPAGMVNSGFFESDDDVPNLATGYTNWIDYGKDIWGFYLGKKRNTSIYNGAKGNPSGNCFSTLDDLLKFTMSVKNGKLISTKSFELMSSYKITARKYDAGQTNWGYGFELETENGKRIMGHGGGDFGISSGIRMFPDSGNYTLIILCNYDRGGIIANYKIQEWLTQ